MNDIPRPRTAVMTGGTSGFGRLAVQQTAPTTRVHLGARSLDRAAGLPDHVQPRDLDLASLASVRNFCRALTAGPDSVDRIDALVLNAGISPRKTAVTADRLDLTFQTNYLGHFAILNALTPRLADDALVLITGSGTHDPEENTPAPPPKHADARRLAYPQNDPALDRLPFRRAARGYTSSKLCCILLALAAADRLPGRTCLAFDPALVPGTGLTRDFPGWLVKLLMPFMIRSMPRDRTGDLDSTARALAAYLDGRPTPGNLDNPGNTGNPGKTGDYVAMRAGTPVVVAPSALAQDPAQRQALWQDSQALLRELGYEDLVT